jgi:hypothetical protein
MLGVERRIDAHRQRSKRARNTAVIQQDHRGAPLLDLD